MNVVFKLFRLGVLALSASRSLLVGVMLAILSACGNEDSLPQASDTPPVFVGQKLEGCIFASPLIITSQGETQLLVLPNSGRLSALDLATGRESWRVDLPVSSNLKPSSMATPAVVGHYVIVAYAGFDPDISDNPLDGKLSRQEQLVAVVDLEKRAISSEFERLVIEAEVPTFDANGTVTFHAPTQLARATVQHVKAPGQEIGTVYVSFGNKGDIQPWHGWVFEIDLDKWRARGPQAALMATLLTTPDHDCGEIGSSGMRDMRCGGGVWSPAGPQVFQHRGGYEIVVPTGNGHTDLEHGMYANALLRMERGLRFDPQCSADLCRGYDPIHPASECLESCRNLFVPHLMPGDPPLRPESGVCDNMSFFECYARLDYDFGASSPVRITLKSGKQVFLQPAKDGHLYLLDGEHLGKALGRLKIVDICGTREDPCKFDWAGMIVTQPSLLELDGNTIVLIPTFMYDQSHPAGVVAVRVEEGSHGVSLRPLWQAPSFDSAEALSRFRSHPSRIALSEREGEPIAWVVDVKGFKSRGSPGNDPRTGGGTLLAIRVRDGTILDRIALKGRGQRYVLPAIHEGKIYVPSCVDDLGPSRIERFDTQALGLSRIEPPNKGAEASP